MSDSLVKPCSSGHWSTAFGLPRSPLSFAAARPIIFHCLRAIPGCRASLASASSILEVSPRIVHGRNSLGKPCKFYSFALRNVQNIMHPSNVLKLRTKETAFSITCGLLCEAHPPRRPAHWLSRAGQISSTEGELRNSLGKPCEIQ